MPSRNYYNFCFLFCIILFSGDWVFNQQPITDFETPTAYHFSITGNDKNDGSIGHPKKNLSVIRDLKFKAGDSILLKGGEIFNDSIIVSINASAEKPILIASYSDGDAIINAGNKAAITLFKSSFINIKNIVCTGSGRKNGNTKPGLLVSDCKNINILNIDVSGFQKSGLQVYNCVDTKLYNINAHDNGAAGIGVEGDYNNKLGTRNIVIKNCKAVNNPGDPSNFTNHSGNGIVVGHCTHVLIDHCFASNNGWDMPRVGNGPVGIWCYEADSVVIQHCISCKNKTHTNADDGGGFDFDGGTSNSVIQYCLSYQNQGSAFGIFQYAGATQWHDNVIRFCISENDGNVSAAQANAYIWNNSGDSTQFKNLLFYNNTLYNSMNADINYASQADRQNFKFFNNIFVGNNSIIKGNVDNDVFLANDWWSLKDSFNVEGNKDFKAWAVSNNLEQYDKMIKGLSIKPSFKNSNNALLIDASLIERFSNYKINRSSPVTQAAINLQDLFKVNTGSKDFNSKPNNSKCLGACTHP